MRVRAIPWRCRVSSKAAPKQKEFRAPDANQRKGGKGKIVAIVLVCLLAVGGAAAGVTYYLELWGGKMLPDVVGMTQSDAVYVLESKGFAVHEEKIKSDDTEGVVLLMDPVAGSREEEGSEVTIHVSEARTIPDVAGKQRDEAAALLEKDGFGGFFVTEKSNEREARAGIAGRVEAAAGTEIAVTVAVPFTVPDGGQVTRLPRC
ncbi:MAG: PASTA domain-containing protein [Eggerthella lenta]